MDPISLGAVAGISIVSGLAQAWQSEKARGASQQKLDEIARLFASIVPPEYDVSVNDPPEYLTAKLSNEDLDFSKLTPEQFKVIGNYSPEAAAYVAEANPTTVQNSAQGLEGRQAQIDALRSLQKVASGKDPAFQAKMEEAARNSQINAQSRSQSALQDSQRRGTLGSGTSFAALLQGNSDSMLGGAQAGRDAAVGSYNNQLGAIQSSGSMGRSMAQDDFSQQATNADIINQFNQRTSKNYQQYLNNRSELANQAQMYNLQTAQGAADKNVAQTNDMNKFNLTNRNSLAQQQYGNQVSERNYQNSLAESQAKWAASEKDRQNTLKSQSYNDQLQRANGIAGTGAQQIQMNTQNAADRNQIIAGLGNSVTGGISAYSQQQADDARWDKYIKARYGS